MSEETLRPEELADAARAAISDAKGRPLREAAQVLAQAGLLGVCAPEAVGGLGLPLAFAVPVVQAAGELQLNFPLVEQMLLARHLGPGQARALADGSALATVAWRGELASAVVQARQAADCDWVCVPERTADGLGAALIAREGLKVEDDAALDPEQPKQWLHLQGAQVLDRLDALTHAAFMHEARLLLAACAQGAAAGALQATVTHLSTRVQFGRPLSARQAVRHSLSRMKLAQEVSSASIARALQANEYGQPRDARTVLAGAVQQAVFVIEKAIHLHGGMGFTWDVPLHRALREVRKLDAALGSGALASEIGQSFIASA